MCYSNFHALTFHWSKNASYLVYSHSIPFSYFIGNDAFRKFWLISSCFSQFHDIFCVVFSVDCNRPPKMKSLFSSTYPFQFVYLFFVQLFLLYSPKRIGRPNKFHTPMQYSVAQYDLKSIAVCCSSNMHSVSDWIVIQVNRTSSFKIDKLRLECCRSHYTGPTKEKYNGLFNEKPI